MRGIITFAFFAVDAYVALALVEWRGLQRRRGRDRPDGGDDQWTAGSWTQARLAVALADRTRFVRAGLAVLVAGSSASCSSCSPRRLAVAGHPDPGAGGLGMGLAYSPLALIVLREAPTGEQGRASSAMSLTDSLGTALGTGVTGASWRRSGARHGEPVARPGRRFRGRGRGRRSSASLIGGRLHGRTAAERVSGAGRSRSRLDGARSRLAPAVDFRPAPRLLPRRHPSTRMEVPSDVRRGAAREDPRDPGLPQAGHPLLRHHDPAQGRRPPTRRRST